MVEHGSIIPRALSAYLSAVNEDNPHCDDWHYPKMPESMFCGITSALMDYSTLTYYIAAGCSPFEFEKDEYELEKLVSLGRKYADNYFHYGFLTWYDDGVLYVKWFKDQSRDAFEHAAMVFETTLEAEGITLKEEGGE